MITDDDLIQALTLRNPTANVSLVRQAYAFAQRAHEGQKRASGAPYFEHPAEVAMILARIHLDSTSIIAALLHDTVEDTSVTLEDIKKHFGSDVAFLVHSVTKLSRLQWSAELKVQASQFHKLLMGMARDMRALLIKLADRLHNMRTLHYLPSLKKQQKIAKETLEIYAPLAERIGIQKFKDEMEDIATRVLYPELYQAITQKVQEMTQSQKVDIEAICQDLHTILQHHHIQATVIGRTKTPPSIIRKMECKHLTFEQLTDLLAFRVVVETRAACYQALGILHGAYVVLPGRFKDYISIPKSNGYQSLHTGLIGPSHHKIEVQIRTKDMDDIAHYGVAAHWWHKNPDQVSPHQEYAWLRDLLEIIEHSDNPEEVMERTSLEVPSREVHCFTPKNRLITLPTGSTCFDFAYAVHTWVGDHCVGAKINGRLMPLRTQLANGDIVDILTSESSVMSPEWARFAMTSHARARIRRMGRAHKKEHYALLGRALFEKKLARKKIPFTPHQLLPYLKTFDCVTLDDLWAKIGHGFVSIPEVLSHVFPQHTWGLPRSQKKNLYRSASSKGMHHTPSSLEIPIHGLIPGLSVRYAGCCYPLPGDRILGILVSGKNITVHREDCPTVERYGSQPDRLLNLAWKKNKILDTKFIGRLSTRMVNQPGNLAAIAHMIGKNRANIVNLKITQRTPEFFDFAIDMELASAEHLQKLITLLKTHKAVCSVERL